VDGPLTGIRARPGTGAAQKHEYILPIRLDDAEVHGLPSTICHLDARRHSIQAICDVLFRKIRGL